MPVHVVKPGECLTSIAAHYGFLDHRSLYEHPDNGGLKKKRPNPNIVHPGDEVVIPEKEGRTEECATGRVHGFVMKRARKTLHLKLQDEEGEPLSDTPYLLRYDDVVVEDETNGDGEIRLFVPLSLKAATLDIQGRRYQLEIGGLNPLKETDDDGVSGLRHRLANLGIDAESNAAELDEDTQHALALFQLVNDLPVTGHLDDATRKKLEAVHGC